MDAVAGIGKGVRMTAEAENVSSRQGVPAATGPAGRAAARHAPDLPEAFAGVAPETETHRSLDAEEAAVSIERFNLWYGLSQALFDRTAIEPAEPVAVDIERDEIALYPFLYWPVTETSEPPSEAAVARLNDFLRFGGMILFDTKDADLAGAVNATTPSGRALQRIAARLDVPPLEPVPHDHVLTRTFYLLQDFPGRWADSAVWLEASADPQEVEGLPFRNLNDGVTPVVIGGNDWAAAWATQDNGQPMFPVGRGIAGERQREMALRFGINLIMYVMTGNYKSDQVHVPALLDRLGQ